MRPGILGSRADPQVRRVADRLRALAAEPTLLDLRRFPSSLRLTVGDGHARADGIDVGSVDAWYVRSIPLPLPFLPLGLPSEGEAAGGAARVRREYAAGRERRSFAAGFLAALARGGARFVNRPDAMAQHFRKLEQLDALRDAAVPVPRTLAGNDPAAVVDFAAEHGAVVYKPLAGGALARRLEPADLDPDRLRLLARAPVLFQEEVPGRNLRAYVVDGVVVAAYEICSDALDYRGAETGVAEIDLTAGEDRACRDAARACGLVFAGIDVRRRPDTTFAVLEANPSPMFAAIERRTATTAVTNALAASLLERRSVAAAGHALVEDLPPELDER